MGLLARFREWTDQRREIERLRSELRDTRESLRQVLERKQILESFLPNGARQAVGILTYRLWETERVRDMWMRDYFKLKNPGVEPNGNA